MKARILVIEDEMSINDLLCMNLEIAGYETVGYLDGNEAYEAIIQDHAFQCALVDIMLPGRDGYSLLPKLKQYEIPVIFLTAKGDIASKIKGLKDGAEDYIVKPFRTRELISRIKSVLRRYGQKEENSNIIQYKNIKIDTSSAKVYKDNEEIIFTSLEYRILFMLFSNQNKLITREQLLEKIWDVAGNFVNDNTLTVYIKRIREKLGDDSIIKTVRGLGYRIGD